MTILEQHAFKFAIDKHAGQEYNGGDFFLNHPFKVYCILKSLAPKDVNLQIAGLLHDTLEDTDATMSELQDEFNDDIAELVKEVTKTGHNVFPNLKTQRGVVLKFADRMCNLYSMDSWTPEKQAKYIVKSKFWKEKE